MKKLFLLLGMILTVLACTNSVKADAPTTFQNNWMVVMKDDNYEIRYALMPGRKCLIITAYSNRYGLTNGVTTSASGGVSVIEDTSLGIGSHPFCGGLQQK